MRQNQILSQLNTAFADNQIEPSKCIVFENVSEFFIEDNEYLGYCIILKNSENLLDENKLFRIENPRNTSIALWAVDGKFFPKGEGPQRCDCIFFDNTDFCFAEFKFNATSVNLRTIRNNREKAINQLRSTILMIDVKFKEMNFDYVEYNLEAFLCTPVTYPSKNTAISDFAVEFIENFGVKLYEQNSKTFFD
jgi:hypothetical protein